MVYLKNLHVPTTPTENYEVLQYFMDKAVSALKAGNTDILGLELLRLGE